MSLYKRGDCWWYGFWHNGQRVQCGTKTRSKRQARRMEAVHKAQLVQGKYELGPKEEPPKFSDFAERYLEYSRANKSAYAYDRYCIPKTLVPFFGRYRLDEINPLLVEKYKQQRLRDGLKKSSVNREVGLLKSMLTTAGKWQLVDRNGARDAKLFKLDEPLSDRVLSRDEEEKLLAACDSPELKCRAPHLGAIIQVALYTGLRRGEILRLRWPDVDLGIAVLIVRKSKTAAGQGRRVNLNSALKELFLSLRSQASGEWVFPSPDRFQDASQSERHIGDVKHAFGRAVKLAEIPHITFHQLRHTFCSRLADAGVPLPVIQDLAGHASIVMTRRYTHPGNELKQKAVELLLGGQKEPETATKSTTPAAELESKRPDGKGQVVQFKRVARGAKHEDRVQTAT